MTRYARQTILPQVGEAGQAKLAQARVLVIGAGGLAATALPLLAGAGVGHITIVDGDQIDLSNLHRQHLFTQDDCGQPKAHFAADRMQAINHDIALTAIAQSLTPANAGDLVAGVDLVLDCADSFAVSYTLSDVCKARGVPLITGSALALSGYVVGVCGDAPSLRAVFPDAPGSAASCATAGVLGPVVSMIGAAQAQMALAQLLEMTPSPLGQAMHLDASRWHFNGFRFDTAPEPARAFAFEAPQRIEGDTDQIYDLRGAQEAPDLLHPKATRATTSEIKDHLTNTTPDTRLVLCCATGLRAWRAAEDIANIWPGEIVLVAASAS